MATRPEHFLVTGAAGCIGAWAVRLLVDDGVAVTASDISPDLRRYRLVSLGRDGAEPDYAPLDITRAEDVAAVVRECGITHIVHLAGLQLPFCAANPPLGAMVNVVGTVNMFEAVRAAERRVGLAYASSAAVYGGSAAFTSGAVSDTSPPQPDSHYGVYKAANEGTARVYSMTDGIGSVGLRPFVVYGPGRDQGLTSGPTAAMLAAAAGMPYRIKFGGSVLLTYAPDCARAFIGAARAAVGSGDAVCANVPGRRIGVAALIDLIEAVVPESAGLISCESAPIRIPALITAPALADLIGEVPNCPLDDGIRATIRHFQNALASGLVNPPGG